MSRFAANRSTLLNEVPFLERFAPAAAAGVHAEKIQFPCDHARATIVGGLKSNGLEIVLHNLPPGDIARVECGIAGHPGWKQELRIGVEAAIIDAQELNCPSFNCLVGILPAGVEPAAAEVTLIENGCDANATLQTVGIELLVAPINTLNMPGFFHSRQNQGAAVVTQMGSSNPKLQYDIY